MVRGSVFIPLACRAVSRSCSFLPCCPTGGPGMTWPVVYLQGYMRSRWTCGVMERVRRVQATTVYTNERLTSLMDWITPHLKEFIYMACRSEIDRATCREKVRQ